MGVVLVCVAHRHPPNHPGDPEPHRQDRRVQRRVACLGYACARSPVGIAACSHHRERQTAPARAGHQCGWIRGEAGSAAGGNAAPEGVARLWLMLKKKLRNLPRLFRCRRHAGQHHATGTHLTQLGQSGTPARGEHLHTPRNHSIRRFDVELVFMNFRTIHRNHIQALYWLPQGQCFAATDKTIDRKLPDTVAFYQ